MASGKFVGESSQFKAREGLGNQTLTLQAASKNLNMRRAREETKLTAMTKGFCPSTADLIAQRTNGRMELEMGSVDQATMFSPSSPRY